MISRLRNRLSTKVGLDPESGAAIVLVAVSMTILIGFAAFAVDFGWLYLNGIRIQHGADAAALAGVVYEPGDQTTAYQEARRSAAENGYNDALGGTTVTPVDYTEDATAVDNPYQLEVTISHSVETFFMRVFGVDSISVTRRAVAEYVLPLPMGSDLPYFGEDPSDPSRSPKFWANIHGYYTGQQMGDRYSSQCRQGSSTISCLTSNPNPEARQTTYDGGIPVSGGYVYGIEVDAGATNLAVEVFDGPFYRGGGDSVLVGDNEQGSSPGPNTWFILYAPDPTPLNTTDNTVLCSWQYAPQDSFADFNGDGNVNGGDDQDGDGDLDWDDVEMGVPGGISSLWDRICGTTYSNGPGIYPLRVVIDDPGSDDERGLNRYSIRASTSGTQPRVYGLGDMAVYVNFDGNQATLDLAEVQDVHAGKDLVIELWDPDSGNAGTEIIMPDGTLPPCTWNKIGQAGTTLAACDINYAPSTFHNSQLEIRVHIPDDYTCSSDCWWQIEVTYPGGANDTTTWSARIEGNPVALVE
ncbi:MAG: Tad domain-containing protein [Acidimicrobiia bacterium]|nr:Tad domain-containing protein [Acidimicrobiia bacterium]